METIFDHNPTDYELTRFGGRKKFDVFKSIGFELVLSFVKTITII